MEKVLLDSKQCVNEAEKTTCFYDDLPLTVKRLLSSLNTKDCFNHVDNVPILSQDLVTYIIQQIRRIIFPGYFSQTVLAPSNYEFCLNQDVTKLFKSLSRQIILSLHHDCLRYDRPCSQCFRLGHKSALQFIRALPELRAILADDVRAAMEGDPAAKSFDEFSNHELRSRIVIDHENLEILELLVIIRFPPGFG